MNLIDMLDFYAMLNHSSDLFLMLQDYTLDDRIDREDMNKIIIKELGSCRPFVHESTVFKFALEEFFNKYNYNIKKLLDSMYLEYDPLTDKKMDTDVWDGEHRYSKGDIDNTDKYKTETDADNKGNVSAYDSSTYQPKEQDVIDQEVNHEGETTSDIESTVDTERHNVKSEKGLNGARSYQDLIKQERKLAEFNIFNWIIQRMREELFLLVY